MFSWLPDMKWNGKLQKIYHIHDKGLVYPEYTVNSKETKNHVDAEQNTWRDNSTKRKYGGHISTLKYGHH